MARFLKFGRVIDNLFFFDIEEIEENLHNFNLSDYHLKKWKRMIEVYGKK